MENTYISAKAIVMSGDKFLVLREKKSGDNIVTDLPGGKIKYEETPEDAVRREVMEETCLEVTVERHLGLYWFYRHDDKKRVFCDTYLCRSNGRDIDLSHNPAPEEFVEYDWVTREDFETNEYYGLNPSISRVLQKL